MRKSQSAYELDVNNGMKTKNKKKERTSSPTDAQTNQSYSDIDYFPMMPTNDDQTTKDTSLTDLYLNPAETIPTTTNIKYVTISTRKVREHPISASNRSNEDQVANYKDVDHRRTKALREIIQQRTQQKTFD